MTASLIPRFNFIILQACTLISVPTKPLTLVYQSEEAARIVFNHLNRERKKKIKHQPRLNRSQISLVD